MKKNKWIVGSVFVLSLFTASVFAQSKALTHTGTKFNLNQPQKNAATYQASKGISLGKGFKVSKGSTFTASLAKAEALQEQLSKSLTLVTDISQNVLKVQLDDRLKNNGAQVILYNADGGLIKAQTMQSDNTSTFAMGKQNPGLYIVRYVQNGQIVTKKIYYQ